MTSIAALSWLAACGNADAQAKVASGVTPPAGWVVSPELVTEIRDSVGVARVDGLEAWAEPARGCYAFWLAVRGASAAAIVKSVQGHTATTSDVVSPAGDGITSLAFTRPPYAGRVRARIASGRAIALACFANDREPTACASACTQLLGALP